MIPMRKIDRRRVLRGMMGGTAISVGLPFLDCFLNVNGTAQANGAPLPSCFGSWVEGLGFMPGRWEPDAIGPKYDMRDDLKVLAPFKDKINIYSGLQGYLDGKPNVVHNTGYFVCLGGNVTETVPTIDVLISDVVGKDTRFKSLEVACAGSKGSQSRRSASAANPSEISPAALYTRIFGSEFKDPNSAEFAPDPLMMARRSVISAVADERQQLLKQVGAADRIRLDEYFTALRGLERQIDIALEKPAPLEACSVPDMPKGESVGVLIDDMLQTHRLFSGLLAHALACGQTRVFNVNLGGMGARRPGESTTFHILTHEEGTDPKLGYQAGVAWFMGRMAEAYRDLLVALSSVKEGDGTLLDRCIVMYSTDTGNARYHSMDNIPLFTAGGAAGKLKTGVHLRAPGDAVTRVGLTVQQAMGIPVSVWGTESNRTSKPFSEILI